MKQQSESARCYILHDEKTIDNLEQYHFEPGYWVDKPGYAKVDGGRGGSVKIEIEGMSAILRPYWRGGLAARFSSDRYLWLGKTRSRAWREWHILLRAKSAELPVPQPLGICVTRSGILYRAAIITAFIENTENLVQRLLASSLDQRSWFSLGKLLRKIQFEGFRHADLNASNVLVDDKDNFSIIDFDKARVMKNVGDWQWNPLFRLQRSLEKVDRQRQLHYREDDWQALMDGYQANL